MKKAFFAFAMTFAAMVSFSALAAAKGFYITPYGGANFNDVGPYLSSDTGYVIGGAVGTSVDSVPGLRIEADLSFRHNNVDLFDGCLSADHDTVALLANAAYDLPVKMGPVHPYILAGIGYGHTEATVENISLLKLEASGVAWQLGAGMNTEIADGVKAGIGYRYFNGPELNAFGYNLSDGSNHSVVAEVSFAFN